MWQLIDILKSESLSLVVRDSGGAVRRYTGRGVSDLYRLWREEPDVLRGATVADKVVGRGAAALMIAGGVRSMYALTLSRLATDLLDGSDVDYSADVLVDNIIRRDGKGMCPVEQATSRATDVEGCLREISLFLDNRSKE